MKLVILMYLEDDAPQAEKLLTAHDVAAYSELPVVGHGLGTKGWYGEVAPYQSRMLLAFLTADKAEQLIGAVGTCAGCSDPRHPIRAWLMDVEKSVASANPARKEQT